jgi:hypothetical protein
MIEIKNQIKNIEISDANNLIEKLKNENCYVVILNGKEIQTEKDYIDQMSKAFKFPEWDVENCYSNVNAYLDWMDDEYGFSGFQSVAVFIENYSSFLSKNQKYKEKIMDLFKNWILPFWESEVADVVVEGKPVPYNVYLID